MISVAARPGALARDLFARSRRPTAMPSGDVALLDSGDPDLPTPPHIRAALTDAIEGGATHYGEPFGDPELRSALASSLAVRAGHAVASSDVIVTHGASGGLGAAFLASLNPGDRVVIPDPNYSLYADQVRLAGGIAEPVACGPDLHLDLEALERACRGARMLVICHPCNPTGVVLRPDEMEAVGRIAVEHDLLVLADEAYDAIVFDGRPYVSSLQVAALRDRLLYCNTFSKTYSMTGWRVGYVAAPPSLAAAVGKVHFTLHGPPNTAVQRAALAALTGPQDCVEALSAEYARRRDQALERLSEVPGLDATAAEGTFYLFIRYPQATPAVEMQERLLAAGVALRAGSEFGDAGEGHVRLSTTAAPGVLDLGLTRLVSVLRAS